MRWPAAVQGGPTLPIMSVAAGRAPQETVTLSQTTRQLATSRKRTLLVQRVEGLAHGQIHIQQHNLAALRDELICCTSDNTGGAGRQGWDIRCRAGKALPAFPVQLSAWLLPLAA